jgi:hypothetical protein
VTGAAAELVAFVLLATVLAFAMVQPRGLPQAIVAVPAAGLAVALGVVGPADALAQLRELGVVKVAVTSRKRRRSPWSVECLDPWQRPSPTDYIDQLVGF